MDRVNQAVKQGFTSLLLNKNQQSRQQTPCTLHGSPPALSNPEFTHSITSPSEIVRQNRSGVHWLRGTSVQIIGWFCRTYPMYVLTGTILSLSMLPKADWRALQSTSLIEPSRSECISNSTLYLMFPLSAPSLIRRLYHTIACHTIVYGLIVSTPPR